jgi:hypothetical protein
VIHYSNLPPAQSLYWWRYRINNQQHKMMIVIIVMTMIKLTMRKRTREWNNLSHSFVMGAIFAQICWTWKMKSRSLSWISHHKRNLKQENFLMKMESVMRLTFNMFKPYSVICIPDRRQHDAMPRRRLFFLFIISFLYPCTAESPDHNHLSILPSLIPLQCTSEEILHDMLLFHP